LSELAIKQARGLANFIVANTMDEPRTSSRPTQQSSFNSNLTPAGTTPNLSFYVVVVLGSLLVTCFIYAAAKGWIQGKQKCSKLNLKSSTASNQSGKTTKTKPMSRYYKPEQGQRTGIVRLFHTNKGLKTFEVNHAGFPIKSM
jgi:phage-related minor tail protein